MSAEEAAMDVDTDDRNDDDEVVIMSDGDDGNSEGGDEEEQQQDEEDDDQSEQSEYSYGDYDSDYEGADMEAVGPSAASRAAAAASQPAASAKPKGKDPLADLDKILASINEVFPEAINNEDQAFLSLVTHTETATGATGKSASSATTSKSTSASTSASAATGTTDDNDDANPGQPDAKKPKPNSLISTKTSTLKAGVGYETGRYTGNVADLKREMSGAQKKQQELDRRCIPIMSKLLEFLGDYDGPEGMVQLALKMSPGFNRLLFSLLKNDALLEWGKRKDVYDKLLDLLELFSDSQFYASFLLHNLLEGDGTPDDGTSNCQTLLGILDVKSSIMKRTQEKVLTSGSTTRSAAGAPDAALAKDTIYVCERVIATAAKVNEAIENGREAGTIVNPRLELAGKCLKNDDSDDEENIKPPPTEAEDIATYVKEMKKHRLQHIALVDAINSGKTGHKFSGQFNKANTGTASSVKQKRMLRIASEIAGLSADLPVEWSSGIFVRVDEDRPDILKALIMAPESTPYETGCFEFDIFLPLSYPDEPPKVLIVTGPNHSIRFNPNLYNNGKVCLSLLGTWQGPGWIPETSTLLQVLVSIQSLILVPDPYFNEPGYDASSAHQQNNSKLYDAQIRAATLKVAILGQMKKPSAMFSDVINDHFRLKKRYLLEQLEAWEKLEVDAEKEAAGKPVPQSIAGGGTSHSAKSVKACCDEIRAFMEDKWPDKKKKKKDGKE